ncbi:sulfatase [bacterium]|jgi:arylsulfatase A-like enzyme|nr:sulfatase [bacterium]MDB4798343.1 sulfatase [Verrucomicrobiota bacterium]
MNQKLEMNPSIGVMSRRALLGWVVGLICLAISGQSLQGARPNIVFIFTDDHGSQSISAYGSKVNQTPNIDRIANEGMLFENCMVSNAICGPSRAVILTGKHSHINGFTDNRARFDGSQETFPKLLRGAGYQTAMIGKWHLKSDPTGFDYWDILIGQGPYYNPPMIKNGERVSREGYTTEILTDLALDWLKDGRDKEKPFMLMYQHKAPHRNWQPGPKYLDRYDDVTIPEPPTLFDKWEGRTSANREQKMTIEHDMNASDLKLVAPRNLTESQRAAWDAAYEPKNAAFRAKNLAGRDLVKWKYQRYAKDYLRCVAAVDDNIGRVLDYLDENGLSENTIVIYSSDQGWYLGEHGWFDKRWMYEESLRMPFLIRWPGVIKAGSRNRDLIQNIDFAPTFLELAGATTPDAIQGRSIVPLLKGQRPNDWRDSLYYHYYEFPGAHSVRRHYGVRTERYKLIHFYRKQEWEFFDLATDPDEMRNEYGNPNYRETLSMLKGELDRLRAHYQVTDEADKLIDERQRRKN